MIRILYVHGYNGKPNGGSFQKLAKYAEVADFDGEKVEMHSFDYDAAEPFKAERELRKYYLENDIDLIIGSSLGGFIAASCEWARRIVVNPCWKPSVELPKVGYTGPIDEYFDFCYGPLSYRSVRFETEILDTDNYQGNAVVNYTDRETPYTRIIEHKHFAFGTQPKTVISREYSREWDKDAEPYYPVNDDKNNALYERYRALAENEDRVIFGGRLGQYKYYDMDAVILSALEAAKGELNVK